MPVVFTGISGRNQKRQSVIILAPMVTRVMILTVVLVLLQRTSLYAHPYDCCRVAANAPALRRTASCRAAQRWRIGARADPDVPHTTVEQRASCSVHQPERNWCERVCFRPRGPDSSVGGVPVGYGPDEVHMEEEDTARWSKRTLRQRRRMWQTQRRCLDQRGASDEPEVERSSWKGCSAASLPVVTMRLTMTHFCLRQFFSGCQNLSFGIDASRIGLLNRLLGLICRPDGFAGWLRPQATTSKHIQMYHRGTRRINFPKKNRRINISKKTENKRFGRPPHINFSKNYKT